MNQRVNSFVSLSDPPQFETKPRAQKPVEKDTIEQIAEQNNFPSRQAAPKTPKIERRKPRRYRTGRNQHLAVRATAETVERFYKAADARHVPLGELLRLALDALDGAGVSAKVPREP